jgi:MFS transporter, DHA3 family, macrolide efflux protein
MLPSTKEAVRVAPRRFTGMTAFWWLWAGSLVSFTGSGLTRFALSVWVYQETRDPLAFAGLLFFATIPLALASLVAGPLVDRWDRRRVLIAANLLASLPTLAVLLLYLHGGLLYWHLAAALFVNGLANAFLLPAVDSGVRMLVPHQRLAHASGYVQMIQTLGLIVAPPVGGLLLMAFGLWSIFVIDIATAALAVAAVTVILIPRPERRLVRGPTSPWQDFVFGLRYVRERSPFVTLMVVLAVAVFAASSTYAASGPVVLDFGDERTIGLAYAAYGAGSVVGAFLVGATGGPRRRVPGILLAAMVMGLGALLTGWRPLLVTVSVGVFVLGAANSVLIALHRAIFQLHAAPEVIGRVFSLRLVVGTVSQAAGMLATGWLAATVFEPGLSPGGALAGVLGPVVGIGEGRGAAALVVLGGAALCTFAAVAAVVPALRGLEARLEALSAAADALASSPAGATAVPSSATDA